MSEFSREEIESVLSENGFKPSKAAHIWCNEAGTAFVAFPENGDDEGDVIYGSAGSDDEGENEPGARVAYASLLAIVVGGARPAVAMRMGGVVPDGLVAKMLQEANGPATLGLLGRFAPALTATTAPTGTIRGCDVDDVGMIDDDLVICLSSGDRIRFDAKATAAIVDCVTKEIQ